ncbi:MAG: type II secretion system F family protein [Bacteroidia bacterium]
MSGIDISKYSSDIEILTKSRENKNGLSDILNKEISFLEKKFGAKEKEGFYSELGLLLSTGVDIQKSLEIILEDIKVKNHTSLISQIKDDIISGCSVYEAIIKHHKVFTKYEAESIKIGEESGKLPEVLNELGAYYKSAIKLKRQIVGVLTYPVVVISLAILIVYFMLAYVVPIFSDVFTQTGNELPELTQFLIKLSNKSDFLFYVLVGIIGGLTLSHKLFRLKDWYRKYTSSLFLRIPMINKLIQKVYLARFCQSMKLLVGAKVMVNESLELISNMIGFYPIETALAEVKKDVVNKGMLLNESLAKHKIFPTKLIALIKLSEEVNAPEVIFEKLYNQYSDEIEHQQAVLGKLIEPLFIIILGLFVGFILVAMYLPMFEMSSGNF